MTEAVDPAPDGDDDGTVLGGRREPSRGGDPTAGGKRGEVDNTGGIAADEPDDGSHYPVGGGSVSEESDAVPTAETGPER